MKISFLFGSGISKFSGLQTVQEMTDAVFNEPYFEHTSQDIIKGMHPSEFLQKHYDVRPLQDFLELIREKSDSYLISKLGYQHRTTYEDLYYIADQIDEERHGSIDNLAIVSFIKELEDISFPLRLQYKRDPGFPPVSFAEFCSRSKILIETVVKYGLLEKPPIGLDLLSDLTDNREVDSLEIFTLNHDTLLEKLFIDKNVPFCDGFSSPDGDIRWYKPSLYDESNRVNIYHLHGARNWSWVRTQEIDQYAILTGNDKWHSKRADGTKVTLLFDKGNLLTGANKSVHYLFGIFGELFYRFFTNLRNTESLIVSGYGWNDYAINRKLFDWLDLNESAKLLLIHKDLKGLIHNSRYPIESRLLNLRDLKKIFVIDKWFEEVTVDETLEFLSD